MSTAHRIHVCQICHGILLTARTTVVHSSAATSRALQPSSHLLPSYVDKIRIWILFTAFGNHRLTGLHTRAHKACPGSYAVLFTPSYIVIHKQPLNSGDSDDHSVHPPSSIPVTLLVLNLAPPKAPSRRDANDGSGTRAPALRAGRARGPAPACAPPLLDGNLHGRTPLRVRGLAPSAPPPVALLRLRGECLLLCRFRGDWGERRGAW